MSNILVIEDDVDIRELIVYNLEKVNFTVTAIDNANDALIVIEDMKVDAILLDLMLPGLKGSDFLSIVRSRGETKNIPIIVISAKNTNQDIINCLELGADDYLPKPFSFDILIAKINSALRRKTENYEENIVFKNITIDNNRHKVFVDDIEIKLTHKEYELLQLFIKGRNKIYTRNQLLNSIWGYSSESLTRTVDSHISSLRKKLGKSGNIIKSVAKIGYGVDNDII